MRHEEAAVPQSNIWNAEFGVLFWVHLAVIMAAWLSPLLFPWRVVAIGVMAYYAQLLIVGTCILTKFQFGTTSRAAKHTFWGHYLRKLGLNVSDSSVTLWHDIVVPMAILGIAAFLQIRLGFTPVFG